MSKRFEVRFNIVRAVQQSGQFPEPVSKRDAESINTLAAEGWQVVGVCPNPHYAMDQLIVTLQRELEAKL